MQNKTVEHSFQGPKMLQKIWSLDYKRQERRQSGVDSMIVIIPNMIIVKDWFQEFASFKNVIKLQIHIFVILLTWMWKTLVRQLSTSATSTRTKTTGSRTASAVISADLKKRVVHTIVTENTFSDTRTKTTGSRTASAVISADLKKGSTYYRTENTFSDTRTKTTGSRTASAVISADLK